MRMSNIIIALTLSISTLVYAGNNINSTTFNAQLTELEKASDGHIGLSAVDMSNHKKIEFNANERFPMGCTSKVMGVATILKQSMSNSRLLQERIFYKKSDLVNWTPITQQHLNDGMTVNELCAAAIEYSDNTAMNLLVTKIGGLSKINQFAKSIGNNSFRQDRNWPGEALAIPGGVKDTSTPNDMEHSLQTLLFSHVLAKAQRDDLQNWLQHNTTGDNRIRKGIPKGWVVGDKTGTGFYYGITNDIAVIWPPHCAPIVMAVYYHRNTKDAEKREEVLGQVAKFTLGELAKNNQCLQTDLMKN